MLEVVIVSYRCGEMLRRCLESLRDHPPDGGLRVTVVDNASGDGTADVVPREFPDMGLIELEENVGFSAANNLVLRETTAEYVLVLNPDTVLCERTLDTLLRLMAADERIGIVGCRLVQEDGTLDHAARRSFPTPASAPRPLPSRRPLRSSSGVACAVPGTGRQRRPGRRRQRGVHAHEARNARRDRPVRRGLLDVHGGSRPLLQGGVRRLDHLVRAVGGGTPHQGRHERASPCAFGSTMRSTTACSASTARTSRRAEAGSSMRSSTAASASSFSPL